MPPSLDQRTRGHQYKIKKRAARLDIRKHFFGLRVVDAWNSLPKTVVEAPSLNAFKGRLDRLLADHHYTVEIPSVPLSRKSRFYNEDSQTDPQRMD